MAGEKNVISISDMRGGRNDTDSPINLGANQGTEVQNVDWKDTTFARKRAGASRLSTTGGTAFGNVIRFFKRHLPGSTEATAEFWAIDGNGVTKRLALGTTWADVTYDDAITSLHTYGLSAASFNGKLFIAHASAVDRMHVYDPNLSSARVRRMGIDPGSSAPTVANTGAGAYAATLRYYRVRFYQLSGSTWIRLSEPTPSVSFTPSGAGTAARVTRPTAPGEGETHWLVEGSEDNATFYWIATGIAIATTTSDDSTAPSSYSNSELSPESGLYALPTSANYLLTDGNRLLMAGNLTNGKTSRIQFTPVLGSADIGDDERVPNTTSQKNWVDLNEKDGGGITGIGGPINGVPYAFKYRQIWKLRPTGDVSVPYLPRKLRDDIGCVAHHSIAIGGDQSGRSALYFMSHRGPFRITFDGDVQYLGRDNEVMWRSVNLSAFFSVAHSVYHTDLHQWWLWIATGSDTLPSTIMVFDVRQGFPDENGQIRGGWTKYTGTIATSMCSTMFSNTPGATMSLDLKPHIQSSNTLIIKCDDSTVTSDDASDFQALITTRPLIATGDLTHKMGLLEPTIVGKAQAGSDVTVTLTRDFGLETRTSSVSLAPSASETRLVKKVEGCQLGECDVLQITVGDSAANAEVWSVDAIIVPTFRQEPR